MDHTSGRASDMSDFLQITGKTFLVFGVANRKSVAWFIAKSLEEQGARVVYTASAALPLKAMPWMFPLGIGTCASMASFAIP